MTLFIDIFLMALGGSLGACCRYFTTLTAQRLSHYTWPGTLAINVFGSGIFGFSLGALGGLFIPAFQIGFLGAFTTFSMFMLESHRIFQARKALAALYVILSVVSCVIFFLWGIHLGGQL